MFEVTLHYLTSRMQYLYHLNEFQEYKMSALSDLILLVFLKDINIRSASLLLTFILFGPFICFYQNK